MDEVDLIIAFESGDITSKQVLELFSMLIKNGHAWTLQGIYGRLATKLIKSGYLSYHGDILKEVEA